MLLPWGGACKAAAICDAAAQDAAFQVTAARAGRGALRRRGAAAAAAGSCWLLQCLLLLLLLLLLLILLICSILVLLVEALQQQVACLRAACAQSAALFTCGQWPQRFIMVQQHTCWIGKMIE